MSGISVYINNFRANDLTTNTGKQFEVGKEICSFLELGNVQQSDSIEINLTFKAIDQSQLAFNNKNIKLKLSAASKGRGDRKAYADGGQQSEIKNFFISDLGLKEPDKDNYSFVFLKDSNKQIYLYVISNILRYNFIEQFSLQNINSLAISSSINNIAKKNLPLQQIFYGAPGTGKSHRIKELTENEEVYRTTFHPDSDYSSFVGSYKPTTITVPVYAINGQNYVPVLDSNGTTLTEEKIIYQFVSQCFFQAYVSAWKKIANTIDNEEYNPQNVFLIIEEINRGNCAQIFGDLFQLLDRGNHGFSEYPIKADADMQKHLEKEFRGINFNNKSLIDNLFKEKNVTDKVFSGNILLLPNNLFILASMNTSDQSLFPIDSAFKRRWDWNYTPISDEKKNWSIQVGNNTYDWWQFLEAINEKIGFTTNSEDKKLGYYFCKTKNNVISAESFVGKVIFYLWNDVFKDYDYDDEIFNDNDGSKLEFNKFYLNNSGSLDINLSKVDLFLSNLKLKPINTSSSVNVTSQSQIGLQSQT